MVRASPKPAPTVVGSGIFRVDDEVYVRQFAQRRARKPKDKFIILPRDLKSLGFLPFAPSPPLPAPEKTGDLLRPGFNREEQVAFKGQEDRRSFAMLGKGKNRRADFLMRAECDKNILRSVTQSRQMVTDD